MENENKPFKEVLGSLRRSNLNRIILAHLNINSIPNKFNLLAEGVRFLKLKSMKHFQQGSFILMDTHLPIDWIEIAMEVV